MLQTIQANGNILNLSQPVVMGILNATPDSFYTKGKASLLSEMLLNAEQMIMQGATILDIGGMSTRPGAPQVDLDTELQRVIPAVTEIRKKFPHIFISIDTYRSEVAHQSALVGADIINDISAGDLDNNMFNVVAHHKLAYLMMHMQGNPQTMQINPEYEHDIVLQITKYFIQKINQLNALSIYDIILDIGFGFGKSLEHNYTLLKRLQEFEMLGYPMLAGLSRKSMLQKLLDIDAEHALNSTSITNIIALQNNAKILRVHDVKEAMECVKIYKYIKNL